MEPPQISDEARRQAFITRILQTGRTEAFAYTAFKLLNPDQILAHGNIGIVLKLIETRFGNNTEGEIPPVNFNSVHQREILHARNLLVWALGGPSEIHESDYIAD